MLYHAKQVTLSSFSKFFLSSLSTMNLTSRIDMLCYFRYYFKK